MLEISTGEQDRTALEVMQSLGEVAREGARRMVAAALSIDASFPDDTIVLQKCARSDDVWERQDIDKRVVREKEVLA